MFGPSSDLTKFITSSCINSQDIDKVKLNRKPYHLTYRLEEYVQLSAYAYFLQHGSLLPPSSLPPGLSDEEYLNGVMSFSNRDLPRYAVGRAIERDTDAVRLAGSLVGDLFQELSEFDFRNGPVRRKFDGVKYAVRKIENVLYELAVTDMEPEAKR